MERRMFKKAGIILILPLYVGYHAYKEITNYKPKPVDYCFGVFFGLCFGFGVAIVEVIVLGLAMLAIGGITGHQFITFSDKPDPPPVVLVQTPYGQVPCIFHDGAYESAISCDWSHADR